MAYHSLQAIVTLQKSEFDRLVQTVSLRNSTDTNPYWKWNKDKKHYHVEDYSRGIEATAYHTDNGYFMEFILHFDRLLYGADSHQLPTPSELRRIRGAFAWNLLILCWLDQVLQFPPHGQEDSQRRSLILLCQFYDRLKVQRIDPAINITGLSQEEIKLYSRVLNSGNWNNDKRQRFTTIRNSEIQHPKTFINSCALEATTKKGDTAAVPTVRINCYDKKSALLHKKKNKTKKYKPTAEQIANAAGVYRLEVQCLKPYMESLLRNKIISSRNINDVLTPEFSAMILRYYIHQFAGDGDYYRLSTAVRKIRSSTKKIPSKAIRDRMEQFLILLHDTYNSNEDMLSMNEALPHVAERMGVTADTIDSYRKRLVELGINPITLPNDSTVKELKNPLRYVLEAFPQSTAPEVMTDNLPF